MRPAPRALAAVLLALGWIMLGLPGQLMAAVRATLDDAEIPAGDSVQLTLERDGQTGEQPDLTPLEQDFDVLSTSRSSSVQIINGSMSSKVQVRLTLAPKHGGRLVIPPLDWAGETSPALTLTVSGTPGAARPANSAPAGSMPFLETVFDPADPYVQAAVHVTERVYLPVDNPVYQPSLEFPASSDALMQQVGADENRKLVKNGVEYEVVERSYLVFPQKSGALTLPGAVLAGQMAVRVRDRFGNDPFSELFGAAAGMAGGTRPVHIHGDPINLNVRPRPAESGSGPWIPARSVTLNADWHPDDGKVHVGDPVTLDLHLQAEGLTAAQLPNLAAALALPDGIKAYPDQPKLDNSQHGDTVQGSRQQSVALIATRPGDYVMPALHVSWWDTKANQQRAAELPAHTLRILPAVGAAPEPAATPVEAPPSENGAVPAAIAANPPAPTWMSALTRLTGSMPVWVWVIAVLALLWLATLLAWWISAMPKRAVRARPAPQPAATSPGAAPSAHAARNEFQAACRRNDAEAARRALLAWAAAAWPGSAPHGLGALAKEIGDEAVAARLLELDRACYGGVGWNGAGLLALLRDLPKRPPPGKGRGGDGLAPLYR
jgi:hypothetical protein